MKTLKAMSYLLIISMVALLAGGCAWFDYGKVTGGGSLPGADGGKANFGFNGAECADGALEGRFNYRDKGAQFFDKGVSMNGEVTEVDVCGFAPGAPTPFCEPCDAFFDDTFSVIDACASGFGAIFYVAFDYVSTNPRATGSGTGEACVVDCVAVLDFDNDIISPRDNIDDYVWIELTGGPFLGYTNEGVPKGNIQAHDCTCTDGEDNDGDGDIDEADVDCASPNDDEDINQDLL